jgi:DNA/RNA-binding domain of Phe-tRNA-synthetase-like protein
MRARGGESSTPLGVGGPPPPAPGEVIWRDDAGAVCRCWNWREAARTALSPATRDAVLVVEALGGDAAARARAAADDLAGRVAARLGGGCAVYLLAPGSAAVAIET